MALFGKKKAAKKPAAKKVVKKATAKGNSEAQAILKKMQAKKDAGDCPFC